jgi:hypothetical protein
MRFHRHLFLGSALVVVGNQLAVGFVPSAMLPRAAMTSKPLVVLQSTAEVEVISENAMDKAVPLSQSSKLDKGGRDEPLMKDIKMLSDILSDVIKEDDPTVHKLYEEFLEMGVSR